MLDYLLEEPCDTDLSAEHLIELFEEEVIVPRMQSKEVLDEIASGSCPQKIEDEIWKEFEKWSEEYFANWGCCNQPLAKARGFFGSHAEH